MWGDDVMLLSMDDAGFTTLISVLADCIRLGAARLVNDARMYTFVIEQGAAAVELTGRHSVWRLDPAKAAELVEQLLALLARDRAGLGYVAISAPTDTLLLRRCRPAFGFLDDVRRVP